MIESKERCRFWRRHKRISSGMICFSGQVWKDIYLEGGQESQKCITGCLPMACLILDAFLEQPWEGPSAPYTALALSRPHFPFFKKIKCWQHFGDYAGAMLIKTLENIHREGVPAVSPRNECKPGDASIDDWRLQGGGGVGGHPLNLFNDHCTKTS